MLAEGHGLGFDFGTSGARINVVEAGSLKVLHSAQTTYAGGQQTAEAWSGAMDELLESIPSKVGHNCIDPIWTVTSLVWMIPGSRIVT